MGYAPSEAHWFVVFQCPLQGEHICMCLSSCRAFLLFWGNGSFVFRQKWYHMLRDFCTASACRFLRIPVESLTEEESWKAGEACGRNKQVQRKNRRREGSAADSVFRRHRVRGYGDARVSEKDCGGCRSQTENDTTIFSCSCTDETTPFKAGEERRRQG